MKWKRLISTLMAGWMLFANTAVTITADAENYARTSVHDPSIVKLGV